MLLFLNDYHGDNKNITVVFQMCQTIHPLALQMEIFETGYCVISVKAKHYRNNKAKISLQKFLKNCKTLKIFLQTPQPELLQTPKQKLLQTTGQKVSAAKVFPNITAKVLASTTAKVLRNIVVEVCQNIAAKVYGNSTAKARYLATEVHCVEEVNITLGVKVCQGPKFWIVRGDFKLSGH